MDQTGSFADNGAGIAFRKTKTYHPGDEYGTISPLGVAINVAKVSRHCGSHVWHTWRQRTIDVTAELWPDGPPEFVVFWVTCVWWFNSSLQ
jgi:hypothetical protein